MAVRNMKIVDAMWPKLKALTAEIGLSDAAAKMPKAYVGAKKAAKLTKREWSGSFRQRAVAQKAIAKKAA